MCTGHCSGWWEYSREQNRQVPTATESLRFSKGNLTVNKADTESVRWQCVPWRRVHRERGRELPVGLGRGAATLTPGPERRSLSWLWARDRGSSPQQACEALTPSPLGQHLWASDAWHLMLELGLKNSTSHFFLPVKTSQELNLFTFTWSYCLQNQFFLFLDGKITAIEQNNHLPF